MNIEKFVDKELDKRPATFFCRESIIELLRAALAQDRKEREKDIKQYKRCPHCNKDIIWYTWPRKEPNE